MMTRRLPSGILRGILPILILGFVAAGCSDDPPTGSGSSLSILNSRVEANPHNVVSAAVVVKSSGTGKVRVEFGTDSLYSLRTPDFTVQGDSTMIPVLDLDPSTLYRMRVVATGTEGTQTIGASLTFTTGAMPADIPKFTVNAGTSPSPGYVMFGFTAGDTALGGFYATIVDNLGRIVWYRKFGTQIADFQRQPNGHYTVFSSLGSERRRFFELDALGNTIREYSASGGLETGAHELRLRDDGYILFGVKDSVMDLTGIGGRSNASVRGMVVEYRRNSGNSLYWSTHQHLGVDEGAADIDITAASLSPWHSNAADVDTDGNLLVSFRNSDMVVKVNAITGQVIWRLGGKRSDFTFVNDPLGGFSHQHGIRRLPNGNIILFDNGNLHSPPVSRVVEYRLDESARKAELVWEYRHDPPLHGFALGFAHRHANGNTLICYGTVRGLVEVDQARNKQWELVLEDPRYFIYRGFRIGTLY